MKKYLPIGSVVLLKEADKKLAIVGYMQKETETEKVWDYSAVPYPEGMFSSGNIHLFDAEQIQALSFTGSQDVEGIHFLDELNKQNNN